MQSYSNQIKYVGCAIDQATRDISYNYIKYSSLTIDYCAIHCNAYSYFGMQVGYDFYLIICINFEDWSFIILPSNFKEINVIVAIQLEFMDGILILYAVLIVLVRFLCLKKIRKFLIY